VSNIVTVLYHLISSAIQFPLYFVRQQQQQQNKKLRLHNSKLHTSDIPIDAIINTPFGMTLLHVNVSKNHDSIPATKLVIQSLNLSDCQLRTLPDQWYLPKLKKLNLSYKNHWTDSPKQLRSVFVLFRRKIPNVVQVSKIVLIRSIYIMVYLFFHSSFLLCFLNRVCSP
jgi:hypothetical protein